MWLGRVQWNMEDISLQARERAIDMQVTLRQESQNKLSPKYYGPFMITAKVGAVAYRRIGKLNNRAVGYVLVIWVGHTEEDATGNLLKTLSKGSLTLALILEDKDPLKSGMNCTIESVTREHHVSFLFAIG
ncbi:hypothetical protein Tco_1213211 [Tanacetum coccineum]